MQVNFTNILHQTCVVVVSSLNPYINKINLNNSNIRGLKLPAAYLQNINTQEVNLEEADLERADLSKANLKGTNLSNAELLGADLRGAKNLTYLQLTKAKIYKNTQLPDYIDPNQLTFEDEKKEPEENKKQEPKPF